ncbi:DUF423 domain-containing protein [Polynucleobacter sp. AM-26B4]|uniref:DUF423 domain-containing protein n=1 Tax=Polynucleobacter sp. AM-26B4 TaxID=2689103 RepID=UPI002107CE2C|nr:DUF423 domain-containing protein [Polynucleobacter sp. AM-26B4]
MNMSRAPRVFLVFVGIFGATGVAAGAYGAHALSQQLSPYLLNVFQTAVLYQLIHALALLGIVALLSQSIASKALLISASLMVVGTVLFSGSLYLLTLSAWRVGVVTPLGGFMLISAWVSLLIAAVTYKKA